MSEHEKPDSQSHLTLRNGTSVKLCNKCSNHRVNQELRLQAEELPTHEVTIEGSKGNTTGPRRTRSAAQPVVLIPSPE